MAADFELIYTNCQIFNESGSDIVKQAKRIFNMGSAMLELVDSEYNDNTKVETTRKRKRKGATPAKSSTYLDSSILNHLQKGLHEICDQEVSEFFLEPGTVSYPLVRP